MTDRIACALLLLLLAPGCPAPPPDQPEQSAGKFFGELTRNAIAVKRGRWQLPTQLEVDRARSKALADFARSWDFHVESLSKWRAEGARREGEVFVPILARVGEPLRLLVRLEQPEGLDLGLERVLARLRRDLPIELLSDPPAEGASYLELTFALRPPSSDWVATKSSRKNQILADAPAWVLVLALRDLPHESGGSNLVAEADDPDYRANNGKGIPIPATPE